MPMTAEELFWELVEPLYSDPAVQRSTMMGLPCVRLAGKFFASLDRRSGALLVKLPAHRVGQLIAANEGAPFAPAGRVFREWVAVPTPDRRRWRRLLAEARDHAANRPDTTTSVRFAGFGPAGLAFLAELEQHNTAAFFDAHREAYRQELWEPAKQLVIALGEQLAARVSAGLRAEPRIGGSLFRIAHDRRFRRDQPPYKAHVDLAFWEGPSGPRHDPALLLRITPTEIHLGGGVFALTGSALDQYRAALRQPRAVAELAAAVDGLLTQGAELSEPTRRRPPAGFDVPEPAARFAMRDGFHVLRRYRRPAVVTSARFAPWCAQRLVTFGPVHNWLVHHIQQLA